MKGTTREKALIEPAVIVSNWDIYELSRKFTVCPFSTLFVLEGSHLERRGQTDFAKNVLDQIDSVKNVVDQKRLGQNDVDQKRLEVVE